MTWQHFTMPGIVVAPATVLRKGRARRQQDFGEDLVLFLHALNQINKDPQFDVPCLVYGTPLKGRVQTFGTRDRSIRDAYDERFLPERSYPRPAGPGPAERRGPYSRPEDGYGRGGDYEYDGRFFPNGGGPRSTYHGEDQRAYHADSSGHFPAERRTAPPARRDEYPYRVPREETHTGRSIDFGARAPPPPSVRSQALYPAVRTLAEGDADTLMQAILNLDRGEDRDPYRRKPAPVAPAPAPAPFPPIRERSPARREVVRSPHSRSGSSVSSRGYSPDRTKGLPFPSQQGKITAAAPKKESATAARHRRRGGMGFHGTYDEPPPPQDPWPTHVLSKRGQQHPRSRLRASHAPYVRNSPASAGTSSRLTTTVDRGVPRRPDIMSRRCASSLDRKREAYWDRETQPMVRSRQHTSSSKASVMSPPDVPRNGDTRRGTTLTSARPAHGAPSWTTARPRQPASASSALADPSPERMSRSREESLNGSWSHQPHRQWGDMMDEEFPLDDDDKLPSFCVNF